MGQLRRLLAAGYRGPLSFERTAPVMSPVLAAALLLPIYLATDLVGPGPDRRDYSARNLAIVVHAGLAGVLLGWGIASRVSRAPPEA